MSFILDALRKSESERRRTAAPMLAGVPVEVSRPAVPVWMWVVIGVLAVAVVVLGGAWWTSARTTLTSPAIASAPVPAMPNGASPAAATGAATDMSTGVGPPMPSAAGSSAPPETSGAPDQAPVPAPTEPSPVAAAAVASTPASAPAEPAPAAALTVPPVAAASDAVPAARAASTATISESPIDARPAPASRHESLPTVAEARAAGVDLPPLTIELHVYHAQAASRWVYINGARYTEGRQLAAGPELVEIVPEGVIIADAGREFLLLAQ